MSHISQVHGLSKRVFITGMNTEGYEGFFVDSHAPLVIKYAYASNVWIGCLIRVKIRPHGDLHQVESTDLEFVWSYDDMDERVFFAYAYYNPNEPNYIYQEDLGTLEIEMPFYMGSAGYKPISFKVRQNCQDSHFIIKTEPLIECDGIVVSNEDVQGKMTSFIFTTGCQSYSNLQFTPRGGSLPPPPGSFVKFLVQHDYYVHRASSSHRIACILDEELPLPRGVRVGDFYKYRRPSHNQQQAEMTTITLVLVDYEVEGKNANDEFEHEVLGPIYDAHNRIRPFTLYDEIVILKCSDKRNISPWIVEQVKEASIEKQQLKDGDRLWNEASFVRMRPLSNPIVSRGALKNFPPFHSKVAESATATAVFHPSRRYRSRSQSPTPPPEIVELIAAEEAKKNEKYAWTVKPRWVGQMLDEDFSEFGSCIRMRENEGHKTQQYRELNQNVSLAQQQQGNSMKILANEQQSNQHGRTLSANMTKKYSLRGCHDAFIKSLENEDLQGNGERAGTSNREQQPNQNGSEHSSKVSSQSNHEIVTNECSNKIIRRPLILRSSFSHKPLANTPSFVTDATDVHNPAIAVNPSPVSDPVTTSFSTSIIINNNGDDWENLPITFGYITTTCHSRIAVVSAHSSIDPYPHCLCYSARITHSRIAMLPANHHVKRQMVYDHLNEWMELHRIAVENFAMIPEPERLKYIGYANGEVFRRQIAQCDNWKIIKPTVIELDLCLFDLSRCSSLRFQDVNQVAVFAAKALHCIEIEEWMDPLAAQSRQLGTSSRADNAYLKLFTEQWQLYDNEQNDGSLPCSNNFYILRNALYKLCAYSEDQIRYFDKKLKEFIEHLYEFMEALTVDWLERQIEENLVAETRKLQCRRG